MIIPSLKPKGAILSACREYRYALWRRWNSGPIAMFVGLNPSTADETQDDPTIRRCVAFAKSWGCGALYMGNLFAFRSTFPGHALSHPDPVGPLNDDHLKELAKASAVVVAAWGTNGSHKGRDKEVRAILTNLSYLRLTKDGHPAHPLYLPKDLTPMVWRT